MEAEERIITMREAMRREKNKKENMTKKKEKA